MLSTRAANRNSGNDGQPPARRIKVTPDYFIRDMVFLLIALLYLLFNLLVLQKINLWSAFGMPAIYLMFVIVVVYQNRRDNPKPQKIETSINQENVRASMSAPLDPDTVCLSFASAAVQEREEEIVGVIVEEEKE